MCASSSTHEHNLISYTHSFTPIIICRFTLNLRQVKSPGSSWVSGRQSASLRFVGNAGGSLQFGLDQDEEEDVIEHLTQAEMFDSPIVDEEGDGGITSGDGRTAECVSLVPVCVVIQECILMMSVLPSTGLRPQSLIQAR